MVTTTTGIATEFINFTRASNATVTDSDGLVKWAPHNLLTNSESFDAAAWTKTTVTPTANSIAAPNGTTTADTLAASGANGTALQTFTAEAISYTFGVWLKRKTGTGNIQIAADSGTYTTVTITSDWALYTVTQTPAAGSKSAGIRIVTSADEVYAWGAHLYRSDLGGMQPNTSAYPMYNPTTPKNLLGYTESLTTGWTNSNTTDAIVSEVNPVGLTGAVDVVATAGNGTLLGSLSLLASPYTFSIWLKRKTGSGDVQLTVDGTTYVAAAVTGTWTRFSTTLTPAAGTKTPGIRLVTSGDAVYAWGAQLSDSASLDSYVPVYGAAVTSAAYYGPRRDFDPVTLACKGLLVEEQRASLVLNSGAFDAASWTKFNLNTTGTPVWVNATTSPDGTASAEKLIPSTSNAQHSVFAGSLGAAGQYTASMYLKSGEYNTAQLYIFQAAFLGTATARLDLGTVVVAGSGSPSGTITPVGNGWYRVTLTVTTTGAFEVGCYVGTAGSVASFAGDGTSGIFVYGAQLEAGSFATSYIPTTTASATRNADVAKVSTAAFPYSATEGTLVARGVLSIEGRYVGLYDTASKQIEISQSNATTVNGFVYTSGSTQATLNATANAFATNKAAIAFKENDVAFCANGGTVAVDTPPASIPVLTSMTLNSYAGSVLGSGWIQQITYLPRRISNTELQTRTA